MNKITVLFFAVVTVCVLSCKKYDYNAAPNKEVSKPNVSNSKKWKDNEVLVEWKDGKRDEQAIAMIGGSLKKYVFTKAMRYFNSRSSNKKYGFDVLNVPDVMAAVASLKNNPNVVPGSVAPNYIVSTQVIYPPLWDSLWNVGKLWDKYDMNVDKVWATNQGSRSVVINLQDEGVDPYLDHIYTNIDVPHSHDFLNDDSTIFDGVTHGHHATFTGGQIAGRGGLGVVPYGMLVNTKFLEQSGSLVDALEGMDYTVMLKVDSGMNIRISSNSWGYQGDSTVEMFDAIERFKQADILFVAAQGNNNTNTDGSGFYPACSKNDNVVGVGAKDINQNRASFSNYGATTCHLFAPGVSIPCMDFDAFGNFMYSYPSGTSMACPEVAGACGLIAAANPSWNYAQIKSFLLNSCVRPMPSVNGLCITNGTLDLTALIGSTAKADTGAAQPLQPPPFFDGTPPTPATNVHAEGVTDNSITLAWTNGTDPESGIYFHGILIHWDGVPNAQISTFSNPITITGLPAGTDITFTVYEINKQGLQSPGSMPVTITTTGTKDIIPPTTPPNFRITNKTASTTTVAWDVSTDNVSLYYYEGEGAMKGCAVPFGAAIPQSKPSTFSIPKSQTISFVSVFEKVENFHDATCNGVRWRNWTGPREIHYADLPIPGSEVWWLHMKAVDLTGNSSPYTDTLYTDGTVTPPPPPPPPANPPVINSFVASPSTIDAGQSSSLGWSISGDAPISVTINGSAVIGNSLVVTPPATTTYNLVATNAAGTASASLTVTVNQPPPPLSVSLSGSVNGSLHVLSWTITGKPTSEDLEENVNGSWISRATSGTAYNYAQKGKKPRTWRVVVTDGVTSATSNQITLR